MRIKRDYIGSGGYRGLAETIIIQAYRDLIEAYTDIAMGIRQGRTERRKILKFFNSEWGATLGCDKLSISKIDKICKFRAEYNIWRSDKGCAKCKRYYCPHNEDKWYKFTDMDISKLKCRKREIK